MLGAGMMLEQFARAKTAYDLRKKVLENKRYVQLDLFRSFFPDIVETIYREGGQCVTYSHLSQCIDPVKAYHYTHPYERSV